MSNETFDIEGLKFAYEFHQTMRQKQLILAYEGEVSQQLMIAFTSLAEESLDKEDEETKVKKRVFNVMVESLQNLSKYSDDAKTGKSSSKGSGIFLVGKEDDYYTVTTGNIIANKRVDKMKQLFNRLNEMSHEAVNELYKEKLRNNRLSDKGGAGLGFIDMVKKTGSNIEYHFIPVNEKTSFMLYKIKIYRQ